MLRFGRASRKTRLLYVVHCADAILCFLANSTPSRSFAMTLSSLPDEVLKLVLHHVPLNDRLGRCCLVNRRLHAAAVAATDTVLLDIMETDRSSAQRADCFRSWLPHYGQHLTQLELNNFPQVLQQLPCPNLQHLKVTRPSVQLGPVAGGYPGLFDDCTKLTYLDLCCNFIDAPQDAVLDSLSSLAHLQHLDVTPYNLQTSRLYYLGGLSSSTLPRLTQLTYLQFRDLSVENLAQLGGLTNLHGLTLVAADESIAVGPNSVPNMMLPATLKQVWVRGTVHAGLLSLLLAGLIKLDINATVEGPAQGPSSLLSCMTHLQHLMHLEVYIDGWPVAGPAYSGLTASSSVVELGIDQVNLRVGVWPHVFPATRKLLHLTFLHFGSADWLNVPSAWGAEDMRWLVECCPKLHRLYSIAVQHGPHVSELHKLSALTSLDVLYAGSDAAAFEGSVKGLVPITYLRHLGIVLERDAVTISSLLPLTSMTALTSLLCEWHPYHEDQMCLCHLFKVKGPAPVFLPAMLLGSIWKVPAYWCCVDPAL
jgi:hypothetical protein